MKKYYDKVLFLLALAVLGLGAGIYFKGGQPKSPSPPVPKLTGEPFATIDKPTFEPASQTWTAPPDQRAMDGDPGWTYAIFTPPLIYWEPGIGFTALPPQPVVPVPFGIHLVSAKKELYRVQLQGTSGNGDKDDVVNFSEDGGLDFHLKMDKDGQVDEDNEKTAKLHNIRVKDINFEQVDKGHGVILKVAKVTILDLLTTTTIVLTQGEEYAPTDNQLYVLKTDDPFPPKEWDVSKQSHLQNPDETIEFPGSLEGYREIISFKVVALDFDKPSVTVEKHFTPQSGKPTNLRKELLRTDNNTPPSDQAKTDAASK